MKKLITILTLLLFFPNAVLATNTYSTLLVEADSQYYSVADGSQTGLDMAGDFTVEAWLKFTQLPSASKDMFLHYKAETDGEKGHYSFFEKDHATYGTDSWVVIYSAPFSEQQTGGSSGNHFITAADVGEWVHVACAIDVSAKTFYYYKNAVATSTRTTIWNTATANGGDTNGPFYVGAAYPWALKVQADYKIDELRIWNDIRTAQEIADNYDSELVGNEAGLVGYWKFENNALDETSNNNDLTNNNSATFPEDVPFGGTPPPADIPKRTGLIIFN